MNILFITSEFHPLAKAGGLADAVSALAQALAARGHRVRVVMPRYGSIDPAPFTDLRIPLGVPLGYREEWCGVYHHRYNGVDLYLLEHKALFGDRDGVYGPTPASAFNDNARRFAMLSRGALQLSLALGEQPDVIHAHDWPTGLVPAYINVAYRPDGHFTNSRVVFSIHNFGYQGIFAGHDAMDTGFSRSQRAQAALYHGDDVNFMKSAVHHADWLVAVSPRYAMEIQQPRLGFGLHRDIQTRGSRVTGILNGIDTSEWDPETDTVLPNHYSTDDLRGKAELKHILQRELGLPEDPDVPVVGMVTRLVEQKGVDALFGSSDAAMEQICALPLQVAVLGSGHGWVETEIRRLRTTYRNFTGVIGYSNRLAHLIEAGADFFLMPSVYEPCGLNQMYSMRYGTLPIVTRTGGLADTVDTDTGFFIEDHDAGAIVTAVRHAMDTYTSDASLYRTMQRAAMSRDFSWDKSAAEYEELYTREEPS